MKRVHAFSDVSNDIEKIVSFLSILLISISFLVVFGTPSSGSYELSIYEIYPRYFWFLLLISIIGGNFILIKNSIYPDNHNSSSGLFGCTIIFLVDLILISIPIVRKYIIFGRGDVLSHIGLVKDILYDGFISPSNSYPMVHIFSVQLNLVTGMDILMPPLLIPFIYTLLYLFFFYILARWISPNREESLLILSFAFILFFNTSISQIVSYSVFAPYSQLILMFPLFIYIFLNVIRFNSNYSYRILNIILIFYCVFIHPLSGIPVITMILTWEFVILIFKKNNRFFEFAQNYNIQSLKNSFLLYIIAFSLWGTLIYSLIPAVM